MSKTQKEINKEILGQLIKIEKTLTKDIKVSKKKTNLKDYLLSITFGASFILFFYGLSIYWDWNNFIVTGILLFIVSIVIVSNWEN